MQKQHKIFVYGTLMKGYGNNALLKDAKFVGKGISLNKYCMLASGIPFVNPNEPVSNIKGEVYELNDEQLERADRLEGHPNWYYRSPIKVMMENGDIITAEIYFNETDRSGLSVIKNGDYRSYRMERTW